MVLKATVQKQSSKQLLPKVSSEVFFKIYVPENTVLKSLSDIMTGLKAGNFIKKRLQHKCFPVSIAKFLRTAFFTKQLRWLFLSV